VLASAHVEVVLAVVAVVADVEDLVVGQDTHGPLGVGVVGDVHPERGAALAGVAEVLLDGVGVISEGAGDALGEAAFGLEPLPAVQDLLAGVDPQVALGEPGVGQRSLACSARSASSRMATRNPWGLKTSGRSRAAGSWSDMPVGQATSWSSIAVASR
jgi:hypothetical protein